MEGKTCCVTGHRDIPQKEINKVKAALRREVDLAVKEGFTRFMSGFAEGVDQVIFIDVGDGGQLVQRQVLFKMVVNVAPHQIALSADLVPGL